MCDTLHYLLHYIFTRLGSESYRHVDIPMGNYCAPSPHQVAKAAIHSKAVVLLLLICSLLLLPLWESVIVLWFAVHNFKSILVLQSYWWARENWFVLLTLSSWCLVIVGWLFLTVPWVCLQFLIVVFPDHIHLLSLTHWCKYYRRVVIGSKDWPTHLHYLGNHRFK